MRDTPTNDRLSDAERCARWQSRAEAAEAQASAASQRVQALVKELAATRQRRDVAEAKLEVVARSLKLMNEQFALMDRLEPKQQADALTQAVDELEAALVPETEEVQTAIYVGARHDLRGLSARVVVFPDHVMAQFGASKKGPGKNLQAPWVKMPRKDFEI